MAAGRTSIREPMRLGPATSATVAILGLVTAFAGLEHGVGEVLQGRVAPESVVVQSWTADAFTQLSGEPAMTLLPDMATAGVLTIVCSVAFGWLSVTAGRWRHAGAGLLALSVVLLLVGGGFGPPLIALLLGVVWIRGTRRPRRVPGRFCQRLARWWQPLLAATVATYLGLFPGTVLLHWWLGVDSAALVATLTVTAFSCLALTLTAAAGSDALALVGPGTRAPDPASSSR